MINNPLGFFPNRYGAFVDALVAIGFFSFILILVFAVLSIKWMVAYLNRHGLALFGYYRIALALIRRALKEADVVITTIFVNPAQFGPREDLSKYPRDLVRDLNLLQNAGVDLVWTPSDVEMYPPGYQTWVDLEELTKPLEGAMRPGHFRGVATIVSKLFNAVQPQKAYFGQKDAQQAAVIRRMTKDLDFPIEIVVCPTVREADGLAMSSRNSYLSPQERQAATVLYCALSVAKAAFDSGERDARTLRQSMAETIQSEPLAKMTTSAVFSEPATS